MSYKSRTQVRKLKSRSGKNLLATLIISVLLLFVSFNWILPAFIDGITQVRNIFKSPTDKSTASIADNPTLAPPVFIIPYEATNSAQIDIKGYATANSKVNLYLDDELIDTADVTSDGSFIFKNVSLNLGTNNIYGKTVDDQNKESLASKTIQIIFDNSKPKLQVNEPEDGKVIQGGDKKIKVAGKTDPEIKVYINDSQAIVDKDGNFSSDQPLNEGDNNLNIKAVDFAGNGTEITRKVTYKP